MRRLTFTLLSALMLVSGAGLYAVAQHVWGRTSGVAQTEPAHADRREESAPRPVFVMADPRASGKDDLAAISGRMAGIESKLDAITAQATHAEQVAPDDRGGDVVLKAPDSRTTNEQRNMDEASGIVDAALTRGQWNDADQSRMREVASDLLPADRFALKGKLALAGNAGKLKDFAARPFFF